MEQELTSQNSQTQEPQKSHLTEVDKEILTKIVRRKIGDEFRRLENTSYGYLFGRFPLLTDENMPATVKNMIVEHKTVACASADGVFMSEKQIVEQLDEYYPDTDRDGWNDYHGDRELGRLVSNIMIHEYGHILHGHVFMNQPKDKNDARALVYTNEIETNRGIIGDKSDWFMTTALTDDKEPFTSTKKYITHTAIYREVLDILDQQKQDDKKNDKDKDKGNKNNSSDEYDANGNDQDDSNGSDAEQKTFEEPKNDIMPSTSTTSDCDNQEDALDKLSIELGIKPTKDLSDATKSTNERLEIIKTQVKNKEIQKTLERIKGHLKGEVCKTKVGTYSRPSRKHSEDGLIRRGVKRGKTKAPRILVALDCSGSMDSVSVKNATVAIKCLLNTIGRNRADVDICVFDEEIREYGKAKEWERVVSTYRPYGGTWFNCVMDKAVEIKADVVLCVGDGECDILMEYLKQKDLPKYPRWVDVIIKNDIRCKANIETRYLPAKAPIEREVLWLGNDIETILDKLVDFT